jgi:hypothetical protein
MTTVNYPFRCGTFEGALGALTYNQQVHKLLDYDWEKMNEFRLIIDKIVAETESRCKNYQQP